MSQHLRKTDAPAPAWLVGIGHGGTRKPGSTGTNRGRIVTAIWGGCAALALLAGASGCKTRDEPEIRGQQTAEQWCSECHRVEPEQPTGARMGHILPSPMHGPDFMAIAARPGTNAQWLQGFMADLHLPMPTYRLPVDRQNDVIAYILSLKTLPGN